MPAVDMVHARSDARDPKTAAEQLCTQFGSVKPSLVVMFASRDYDQQALNAAVRERLPKETRLLGATTAGEIDRDGMHAGTVVAGALYGDFDVGIGLGRELTRNAAGAGESAIRAAMQQIDARPDEIASRKYVGLVIDDGARFRKEELLLGVMSINQSLIAVGGGAAESGAAQAGSDPSKWSVLVHVDGEVATDAVAVALFRTNAPWAALRAHWYVPTGQTIRITKIDDSAMRALEIDGQPAAKRYADLLGVSIDDLEFGKPKGFAASPLALRVGREYFIRAPWKPLPDNSILFANMLEQGSELEIVRATPAGEATRRFFESELPTRVTNPRAMLLFHCSGRTAFAAATGQTEELAKSFRSAPTCVGMNALFETYCGFQINSTLTSLAFGATA